MGRELRVDGTPVAGTAVAADVTELVPVRHLTGYLYDPIAKQVIPQYDYRHDRRPLRTLTLRTDADGRFRSIADGARDAIHDYEIRSGRSTTWGDRSATRSTPARSLAGLVSPAVRFPAVRDRRRPARVDRRLRRRRRRPADDDRRRPGPSRAAARTATCTSSRGRASVRPGSATSSRFVRRFADGDVPGIFVIGVRFTGRTYAPKAADLGGLRPVATAGSRCA